MTKKERMEALDAFLNDQAEEGADDIIFNILAYKIIGDELKRTNPEAYNRIEQSILDSQVPKIDRKRTEPYTREEVKALFQEVFSKRYIEQQGYRKPEILSQMLTKASQCVFDGKTDFSEGKVINVTPEKNNRGKKGKTYIVPLQITNTVMLDDTQELAGYLTPYDLQVYNGICTVAESIRHSKGYTEGQPIVFTAKQVYEAFTGSKKDYKPSPTAIENVKKHIRLMRSSLVSINWTQHAELNGLDAKRGDYIVTNENLLYIREATIKSGGQILEGYQLLEMPVLYRYASSVRQICTVERKYLDVPVSNTDSNIAITNYLIRRIEGMKGSAKTRTILFSTIFEKNCITGNKSQLKRRRDDVFKRLEAWKKIGYIKDYKINKKGQEYHSIEIIL